MPPRPDSPRFTNFETGGNVKALAFNGAQLWLGLPNGLIRYDTHTADSHEVITAEQTKSGLLSNGVYMIYVDDHGAEWIGTYGGGLMRYDGRQWTVYTPFGFGSPVTYGPSWQRVSPGGGVGDLWVYDMAVDHHHVYWIATWKGATRYDGAHFQTFTDRDGLADKWVYAVAVDRDNNIWFGTEGGLTRYNESDRQWRSWKHADGLGLNVGSPHPASSSEDGGGYGHHGSAMKSNMGPNPNYILDIAIDDHNVKWIGTWGAGLSRFDDSAPTDAQWRSYGKADGLGGQYVHVVKIDPKGRLWVGSEGGVSVHDNGRWTTYTTAQGLLDNNVFSLAFSDDGAVWIGTWRGLSKLEPPPRVAME